MKPKVLLVTERSAGHIYPALAVAEKIKEKFSGNCQLFFFTSSKKFKNCLKKEGITFGTVFKFRNLLLETCFRAVEALYLILRIRPSEVIGFGGRDSFFLVLFSCFLAKKTAIYEPNLVAGKANKILSFFVNLTLRGIPPEKKGKKEQVVGILITKKTLITEPKQALAKLGFDSRPVILCFGGSQGSEFINRNFIRFIQDSRKDYQVIHLSGQAGYLRARAFYEKIKINYFLEKFYWNMPLLYSSADIVICRAGALTLADISFFNLPALLIPHPKAGGHQAKNAAYFTSRGGAFSFSQDEFDFKKFSFYLSKLLYDQNFYARVKEKITKINVYNRQEDNFLEFIFN